MKFLGIYKRDTQGKSYAVDIAKEHVKLLNNELYVWHCRFDHLGIT